MARCHGVLVPSARVAAAAGPASRGLGLLGPPPASAAVTVPPRSYPARSDPRTLPGGEFDWGGTSVKE